MAACDAIVSLRSPTMGETSGSAIRALSLGKPLVVSDVGWFAELPGRGRAQGAGRRARGGHARRRARGAHRPERPRGDGRSRARARRARAPARPRRRGVRGRARGARRRRRPSSEQVLREVAQAAAEVGIDATTLRCWPRGCGRSGLAALGRRPRRRARATALGSSAPSPSGPGWRRSSSSRPAIRYALARRTVAPWIMVDELIYSELAKSFADERPLPVRDHTTAAYGVVYPVLIAPAWALFNAVPDAYAAAKAINSFVDVARGDPGVPARAARALDAAARSARRCSRSRSRRWSTPAR